MIAVASAASILGRYALHGQLAAGGMATVHLGRIRGEDGSCRTVAIKRLRSQFGGDPDFVAVFVAEALLAARVRHPSVVRTLDVITDRPGEGEATGTFVVMEYVEGESLAHLLRALRARKRLVPPRIATTILSGVLHGLHAAHEAKSESGAPLGIVHRDVSPQNVMVGTDGLPRVLDFGVARATGRIHTTREWRMEGKLGYMSAEALGSGTLTRQSDIYAAAVVLWETLTLRRLFEAGSHDALLMQVARGNVVPPSTLVPGLSGELDAVVVRGLARDPAARWATAREFARALESCGPAAQPSEIGEWVRSLAGDALAQRARLVAEMEGASTGEPVSQDFALTSSEPAEPIAPQARGGKGYFFLACGLAVVVVAVAPLVFMGEPGQAIVAPPPQETTPLPPPTGLADGASAPRAARSTPVEDPIPSAAPAVLDAKQGDASPASGSARSRLPAAKTQVVDCDPPFTRDAVGHKHFKLQCL